MARPSRQATCHPDRKHRSLGLCNNCYINARNHTPEGTAKRHDYYVRNKASIQAKAKANYQKNRPRLIALATIRTRKARQAGTHKCSPRMLKPKVVEKPVSELPRETPVGTNDRQWWKPTDKEIPNAWKMGT